MNFARKTRAVVWAIITLTLVALMIVMVIADIFDLAAISWIYYVITWLLLMIMWIAAPEDDDEKQIRRVRK